MPRTSLDPTEFLAQHADDRRQAAESVVRPYQGDDAAKWDRFNSALVSFMYLHWLQTGASMQASSIAFKQALKRRAILSDLDLSRMVSPDGDAPLLTLPSTPPSRRGERR